MLSSIFKHSSAAISASGALRGATPGRSLSILNRTTIKRAFNTTNSNKIQGDHDWFLIPPKKYWKPAQTTKPTTLSACLACKNLSCEKSSASLAKKVAEVITTKSSLAASLRLRLDIFRTTAHLALLRAIFVGKIMLCVFMIFLYVQIMDNILLLTDAFAFAKEWHQFEVVVITPRSTDNITITIQYKLRPSQWMLLGAVKGLGNAMNGKEYVKVWSVDEEELEAEV